MLYVLVGGCAWRLVPHDLVPWDVAYRWFRAWTADGTWDRVHDTLRDRVRVADGRDPQPSAAVLDSQSARSHQGGQAIGYDAGKRVRGRKRHLLVDTCGLVLRAVAHSASVQVTTKTPDPALTLLWSKRVTTARAEKAALVVVNSVVFRSSGQNLTLPGTAIDMASRISKPVLIGLAARSRVKR
ncbi:hypothetical protein KNE206_77720 [Kitasatospora sp. NE20-6]